MSALVQTHHLSLINHSSSLFKMQLLLRVVAALCFYTNKIGLIKGTFVKIIVYPVLKPAN